MTNQNRYANRPPMPVKVSIDESPDIPVSITRKRIRHLYIRVDLQAGEVRVSAPYHLSDVQIQDLIRPREAWVRRRLTEVEAGLACDAGPAPILLFGEPITMLINEVGSRRSIALEDVGLVVRVRPAYAERDRLELLARWQRCNLDALIPELIVKWEPVLGVGVAEWRVRRMRTRWGTCNIRARRIWINLDLVRFPMECLEYVVVHEMVHLLERGHNQHFYRLMDQFLPDWRKARATLRVSRPAV